MRYFFFLLFVSSLAFGQAPGVGRYNSQTNTFDIVMKGDGTIKLQNKLGRTDGKTACQGCIQEHYKLNGSAVVGGTLAYVTVAGPKTLPAGTWDIYCDFYWAVSSALSSGSETILYGQVTETGTGAVAGCKYSTPRGASQVNEGPQLTTRMVRVFNSTPKEYACQAANYFTAGSVTVYSTLEIRRAD